MERVNGKELIWINVVRIIFSLSLMIGFFIPMKFVNSASNLILNRDHSIAISLDTSSIPEGAIINRMALNLYLLELNSTRTNIDKVHITINLFNPKTSEIEEGISLSFQPKVNSYNEFELPVTYFQKLIKSSYHILIRLIDPGIEMTFAYSGIGGNIENPVPSIDYNESVAPNLNKNTKGIVYNFYNIENSKVQFAQGENIKQEIGSSGEWYSNPWLITIGGGLVLLLIWYFISKKLP